MSSSRFQSWRMLPLGGLTLTLLGTLAAWRTVHREEEDRRAQVLQTQADATAERVERRLRSLGQILRGASGYLARGGQPPSREAWHAYVQNIAFFQSYPGIQGLGFAQWIPAGRLAAHERSVRAEGFASYRIVPGGDLPPDPAGCSTIIYLEPMDERNLRAFGRDMWAEAARRTAMARARDTGLPSMSAPVKLFQEGVTGVQTGTLFYAPVYRPGPDLVTEAQRRERLLGWAFYPIRMEDMLTATLGDKAMLGRIELLDGTGEGTPTRLALAGTATGEDGLARRFEVGGRLWILRTSFSPAFVATLGEGKARVLLLGGTLASLLVFALLHSEARSRARAQRAADRREAGLLASEARYRAFFDRAPVGMAIVEAASGRLVSANPRLGQILGHPPEALLEMTFPDLTHPEHRASDGERMRSLGTAKTPLETRLLHRTGREVWARIGLARMEGAPPRLQLLVEDITESRRAEEALRQSEARWRFALEGGGQGVWDWRVATGEVYYSPHWKAMLGYGDEEIGDTLAEWETRVHPEDLAAAYTALEAHFRGDAPLYENEHRMRCKDGSYKRILDRGMVVAWAAPGKPLRVIGSHTDITDRRRLEESEARALKAEGLVLMAGGIAHDFNNLFQTLQTSLDMLKLQMPPATPKVESTLRMAREALRRAIALAWRMLDFSGRAFAHLEPLEPGPLLKGWIRDLEALLGEGRWLEVVTEPTPRILADPAQLRRVLEALLVNAREAMAGRPGGVVRLRLFVDFGEGRLGRDAAGVWAAEPPPGPATVCLELADEGEGATPEVLARMFDPFFTTRELGRGLGLASVLGLLKAHHAGIHAQRNAAGGLTFRIHFPPAGAAT